MGHLNNPKSQGCSRKREKSDCESQVNDVKKKGISRIQQGGCMQGTTEFACSSCLERHTSYGFLRLECMAPGAQCAFQFLRDRYTPSGSEAFRLLYVPLYVPSGVKEA